MKQTLKEQKMNLEIVSRITDENGTVIEKAITIENCLTHISDFDLTTRVGFLRDYNNCKNAIHDACERLSNELMESYMGAASKANEAT